MNFGAFVDIGGEEKDYFIFLKYQTRELKKVEDVLAVGDEIKVKVYEIDNQDRINLTMKDLEESQKEG